MLVSHRYGFIYTKTAKTAGTSVESFFERFCMPDGAWKQMHSREQYISRVGIIGHRNAVIPPGTTWWNHMPASEIKRKLGSEAWDNYFKFCVIRNPFEKCISAFYDLGKGYTATPQQIEELKHEGLNSEQIHFLSYLQQHLPIDRDNYMIDGTFSLDAVIRHEELESDIQRICNRIGIRYQSRYLPRFKQGIRPRQATVGTLYTKRSRDLVEKAFAFELDFFGYRFPE
jgi:hypothetical protein